ncbi:flagellar biosynthesis regulator FlaF [Sphingomonas psychrotolerans]|uniref:Flagellar biosynthesis regulator FlaF n=1 Tax=Sphingomonas psychrotolerans TaxID=1327635 RepID=A0ABU3MXP1_9SPHN|nr:flagellar biosynthesis regulator FlaF [Sphingomonas psychrotolerans]MDT8757095.1 flagellar biosynthesis regulator FlaF [Sphingomonas psychrotolerans]
MTLTAYQNARSRAETPRAAEFRLMSQITGEMMDAETAGLKGAMLMQPLHRNREMWSAFATDCGATGNGLPKELRAQIISLGLWVERFTSDVVAGREPIGELIALNRTIMEGLRGQRLAA